MSSHGIWRLILFWCAAVQQHDIQAKLELVNFVIASTVCTAQELMCAVFLQGRYSTPQTGPVEPVCSYQPPDRCGGAAPLPCCEREIVTGGTTVSTQASVVYGSIMLLLVMIIAV